MPTLTLKGLPEPLYHQLKARAEVNRRSLNSEIIVCLEQAVANSRPDASAILADIQALRSRLRIPPLTEDDITRAKNEGRP